MSEESCNVCGLKDKGCKDAYQEGFPKGDTSSCYVMHIKENPELYANALSRIIDSGDSSSLKFSKIRTLDGIASGVNP